LCSLIDRCPFPFVLAGVIESPWLTRVVLLLIVFDVCTFSLFGVVSK
jgi:hypothetical protein